MSTSTHNASRGPIGVFDSGFGGLTVLTDLTHALPTHDFIYLGDNARAPYGTRSFDSVYRYTLQAVNALFDMGCPLVILACNTASAKALRSIQQRDLPLSADPTRRVLGVIRPTAEYVVNRSHSGHIGIFATPGTIASESYDLEIAKLAPTFTTTGHACPDWVPLVESGRAHTPEADTIVRRDVDSLLAADSDIDTIILGCTHYPLLYNKIRAAVPAYISILTQGQIVADSLVDYLSRHPEMAARLTTSGSHTFLTTGDADNFSALASGFLSCQVTARSVVLP